MQKKITLFRARVESPDPEALGLRLIERRLARLRGQIAQSQPVADWLDVTIAMWRLQKNDDGGLNTLIDEPTALDYPHYPTRLSTAVRDRIMAWSMARVERMSGSALSLKLSSEERDRLIASASSTRAVYLTEHQVDVAFSDVHKDFPWLAAATEQAWRHALRRAKSGLPAGVGALLLVGPPGLGKSSWARAVGRALTVPSLDIDVGATGGVFDLQGSAKGWGSADKGRLISLIVGECIGNPIVVLDEMDAGSRSVGATSGSLPGVYKVLMGLIEPSTAKAWTCPFYQIAFDLRHVSWICTSNGISQIEQALLDRLTVVNIPGLTPQHMLSFAFREAEKRFGTDLAELVIEQITESLQRGHQPSLRHVVKLLDKVQDAVERQMFH